MTDTKEIASLKEEIATLKADVAALRQRHDEEATMKQQIAALAQQVSKLMAFAAQNAARTGVASPVDEQAILLAARANERARQLTPPVRFGSSTPYDGQSDRIDGKRREALRQMTVKLFCNRCDEPGDITTRTFKTGFTATVNQQDQSSPSHLCPACLAAAMLDAVVSLADTPTAIDYAQVKQRASEASRAYATADRIAEERDELKQKLLDAKSEATQTGRYDLWLGERADLLQQLDAVKQERDVALAKIATAERTAADTMKRNAAATEQAAHEDPEYLASVSRREAKRAGGR
jgi:hypothetical protein